MLAQYFWNLLIARSSICSGGALRRPAIFLNVLIFCIADVAECITASTFRTSLDWCSYFLFSLVASLRYLLRLPLASFQARVSDLPMVLIFQCSALAWALTFLVFFGRYGNSSLARMALSAALQMALVYLSYMSSMSENTMSLKRASSWARRR
jgi:hypothetical protein